MFEAIQGRRRGPAGLIGATAEVQPVFRFTGVEAVLDELVAAAPAEAGVRCVAPCGYKQGVDLTVSVSERDGWVVIAVAGEIDVYTVPELRQELMRRADHDEARLLVDLRGVTFIDSSGLGVLINGFKHARSRGGELALVCNQRRILKVLEVTGLTNVFPIHDSMDAAVVGDRRTTS